MLPYICAMRYMRVYVPIHAVYMRLYANTPTMLLYINLYRMPSCWCCALKASKLLKKRSPYSAWQMSEITPGVSVTVSVKFRKNSSICTHMHSWYSRLMYTKSTLMVSPSLFVLHVTDVEVFLCTYIDAWMNCKVCRLVYQCYIYALYCAIHSRPVHVWVVHRHI